MERAASPAKCTRQSNLRRKLEPLSLASPRIARNSHPIGQSAENRPRHAHRFSVQANTSTFSPERTFCLCWKCASIFPIPPLFALHFFSLAILRRLFQSRGLLLDWRLCRLSGVLIPRTGRTRSIRLYRFCGTIRQRSGAFFLSTAVDRTPGRPLCPCQQRCNRWRSPAPLARARQHSSNHRSASKIDSQPFQ